MTPRSLASRLVPPLALLAVAACADAATGPGGPASPRGVVVLNGFGQQGVTLLPDTGAGSARVDFGGQYDGGAFELARDTVVTTSSSLGGDLLYVADLRTGSLVRLQLPAKSNPAGAAFGDAATSGGILVALRDSGAVALVRPRTGGADVTLLRGAGRCPYDVFTHDGAVWSVDANLNCGAGFTPLGPARLVRIVPGDARRDTVSLGAGALNATNAVTVGDVAYVGTQGQVDYAAQPWRVTTAGSVVKVDLAGRRVLQTFALPAGGTGATVRVGGEGRLYVSYYADVATGESRVIALDPQTLAPVGPRAGGAPYLDLRSAAGATIGCLAATADALGRIHCIRNGAASAATLHVFGADGRELRNAPAGQGAVDLALRP